MKKGHLKLKSFVFLLFLFASFSVSAQTDITPEDVNASADSLAAAKTTEAKAETIWTRKQLTGDWGGARTSLKKSGSRVDFRKPFSPSYKVLSEPSSKVGDENV